MIMNISDLGETTAESLCNSTGHYAPYQHNRSVVDAAAAVMRTHTSDPVAAFYHVGTSVQPNHFVSVPLRTRVFVIPPTP